MKYRPLKWLLAAVFMVITLVTTSTVQAQSTATISGSVTNLSQWINDDLNSPPHWHVAPTNNATTNAATAMATIYQGGNAVSSAILGFLGTLPDTVTPLAGFSFTVDKGKSYTVIAFLDGNGNGTYEVGEPHDQKEVVGLTGDAVLFMQIIDDYDSDGMEDWWEAHWFGDLHETANMDFDNDWLRNITEYNFTMSGPEWSIEPNNWDTDGDLMDDYWELHHGMMATNSAILLEGRWGDRDGDKLSNLAEYRGADGVGPKEESSSAGVAEDTASRDQLNPNMADTDDDGRADNEEINFDLTQPLHSMSRADFATRSLALTAGEFYLSDPSSTTNLFAFTTGGWSVEFWLYPEANTVNGKLYSFTNSTAIAPDPDDFHIGITNRKPYVTIHALGSDFTVGGDATAVEPLPTNKWSHVAAVWSPDDNTLNLYVDGILLIAKKVLSPGDFWPGRALICQGSSFTDGYIDELRIWDYARPAQTLEYWSTRLFPVSGKVNDPDARRPDPIGPYLYISSRDGEGNILQNYSPNNLDKADWHPLIGYFRFDDGGTFIENYAFLNDTNYYIAGLAASVVTNQSAVLFGSDDADGDGIPEWWVSLHKLEKYFEFYESKVGPIADYFPLAPTLIEDMLIFRSFAAYSSIGGKMSWQEASDPTYHSPKTTPYFLDATESCYTKNFYMLIQPIEALLDIYTPGMTTTVVYVNGTLVTPSGEESGQEQSYDIATHLQVGRNRIYVRCTSTFDLETTGPVWADYGDYHAYNREEYSWLGEGSVPYKFKSAVGKFDASLVANGIDIIVRGDHSRVDPRSVWHCQFWSTKFEDYTVFPQPDYEARALPLNEEFGVPFNVETPSDNLDAYYEYIVDTNPRERDTDANGIADGSEDFDNDGLINSEEQQFGSDPWLPDTDDDGIIDGSDAGSIGHPASSLSPQNNRSLYFGGNTNDYLELPKDQRFALEDWTIEAWVKPYDANGGIILQRMVATNASTYEVGIDSNNYPYVSFIPNFGKTAVVLTGSEMMTTGVFTHVAASYYNYNLKLYINGSNSFSLIGTTNPPALSAGGPLTQRMGQNLNGSIDEFRVWDVELTQQDIINTQDEVLNGLEPHLICYYRFDDGTYFKTNSLGELVGTSANNVTNPASDVVDTTAVGWQWGQVEDSVLKYSADWLTGWANAGTFRGNVFFTNEYAVVGPPRLQVFIEPQNAVLAGARWSYDGAVWNDSGALITTLSEGVQPVTFNTISGWIEPALTNVTLVRDQLTVFTNRYIETASLTVIINNDTNVLNEARWRIDGDATWRTSGYRLEGLTPNQDYYVLFRDIKTDLPGWETPTNAPIHVTLNEGDNTTIAAAYVPILGEVQIIIAPSAVETTAQWFISGSTNWWQSGDTVVDLSYGDHVATFTDISGYATPADLDISIIDDVLQVFIATYVPLPQPTSILVDLHPAGAVGAGAQWRVGTAWQDSGDAVILSEGTYTVYFQEVPGWEEPQPIVAYVTNQVQTAISATYYRAGVIADWGTGVGEFMNPRGVAITERYLYVADTGNNRIQRLDLETGFWSVYGSYAKKKKARRKAGSLYQPSGIALDSNGYLWVCDTANNRIQRLNPATGSWTAYGTGLFSAPASIAVDSSDNIYVADYYNNRVMKMHATGQWEVFINNGSDDGYVKFPSGIIIDGSNSLYVSDYNFTGSESRIQKIDRNGNFLEQIASSSGDASQLGRPRGMAFGTNGNLLAADPVNSVLHSYNISNDAWSVRVDDSILDGSYDVDTDIYGNTIIADTGNNRVLLLQATDPAAPSYQLAAYSPKNGSIESLTFPCFEWPNVTNTAKYLVEIDYKYGTTWKPLVVTGKKKNRVSGVWVTSEMFATSGTTNSWVSTVELDPARTYRWRVSSAYGTKITGQSKWFTFDVELPSTPGAEPATATNPHTNIGAGSRVPEFVWDTVPGADLYCVKVQYLNTKGLWTAHRTKWLANDDTSTTQTWTAVESGGFQSLNYRWTVAAWNENGYADYSAYDAFAIALGVPAGRPVAISPTNRVNVTITKPTLTWTATADSTGYYVLMTKNGKKVKQYQDGVAVTEGFSLDTNLVQEAPLGWGDYDWFVRSWNPDGFSAAGYSDVAEFTCGKSTQISPTALTANALPLEFNWTVVTNSIRYEILVKYLHPTKGKYLPLKDVGNKKGRLYVIGATSYTLPSVYTAAASYQWWIRAWGSGKKNYGPWSVETFTIP